MPSLHDQIGYLGISPDVVSLEEEHGISWPRTVPFAVATLTKSVTTFLFPTSITGWSFVFAVRHGTQLEGNLTLTKGSATVFTYRISLAMRLHDVEDGWSSVVIPLTVEDVNHLIPEPGTYELGLETSSSPPAVIGHVSFRYAPSPPLTVAERDAIRANPLAIRGLHMVIADNRGREITPYCALDRDDVPPPSVGNPIWYEDLPENFTLTNGVQLPMRYLRESMHGLLRTQNVVGISDGIHGRKLHSATEMSGLLENFMSLLDAEPVESEVQKFIERNLVLLASFAPSRVFKKPPILNKYVADFGLITSKGRLLLIEIERPAMKLFTKSGQLSSEVQVPFNQVRSWFEEIDQDRAAAIRCIPNCPADINRVDGLVIAGRSLPEERSFRARYACSEAGRIELLTYDQLIANLLEVIKQLGMHSRGLADFKKQRS